MNIGGMQTTDGATYAPSRIEDPPGTRRTRSVRLRRRAGKVSLSMKESTSPSDIFCNSPRRKPSRMPCFTQALTTQRPSIFSAARMSPRVRAERKSKKVGRASSGLQIVSRADKCSMADFRIDSESDIGEQEKQKSQKLVARSQQLFYATHLHSLRISTPGI